MKTNRNGFTPRASVTAVRGALIAMAFVPGAYAANDVPAFHNVDLYTKRSKYDAGFSYNISPQLEVKASYRHEDKTGYKPMSTVSSQVSEFAATIADPIDQTTDQYNLSLNYAGDQSFLKAAYYGSIFTNSVQSVTWQDVNDRTKSATMSSAPGNQFHQFLLTGGYDFSKMTKLVMTGSYARGTQNDAFLTAASAQNGQLPFGLPTSSLNGSVITKAFDAKLTSKPVKDLKLAAAYKYDDRDNRTAVNTYLFRDANEGVSGTASPFQSQFAGAPALGAKINNLDGNYMASDDLSFGVFYTFEDRTSRSAGDAYGSNSTAATQGQAGNTLIANACYPAIAARNANAKMDPCLAWSTNTRDKVDTIGFGAALKNLMAGKLDVGADVVFTRARTDIGVNGGSYVNNPQALASPAPALGAGVPAVFFIAASNQPTISTDTIELRLNAKYALDKNSAVRLLYVFQRMKSTDYAYDGMQFGTGTNYLPTLEQAPNYTVHVIGVSYQRTFR